MTHELVAEVRRRYGIDVDVYNALHEPGYATVGCEPCTRALRRGEHPRTGRWWWEQPDARQARVVPIRIREEAA